MGNAFFGALIASIRNTGYGMNWTWSLMSMVKAGVLTRLNMRGCVLCYHKIPCSRYLVFSRV